MQIATDARECGNGGISPSFLAFEAPEPHAGTRDLLVRSHQNLMSSPRILPRKDNRLGMRCCEVQSKSRLGEGQ